MSPSHAKSVKRLQIHGNLFGSIVPIACVIAFAYGLDANAQPNDWITFSDETWRVVTVDPADPESPGGTEDPAEKDMAVGDLDGDGKADLVVVRKNPFYAPGGLRNVLFMNQDDGFGNRILVDRTADLAPGMLDPTIDRDVVIVDLNHDDLLDVVTASTDDDPPRVYMNLGCCNVPCGPAPCPAGQETACLVGGGVEWCGLHYDETEDRIHAFTPGPKFCAVAAGDVNNDFHIDLYFVDYFNTLEDRLLINDGNGFFTDETEARMTLPLDGQACTQDPADPCVAAGGVCVNLVCDGRLYTSAVGTGAAIVDLNNDDFMDIVKSQNGSVHVIYNNGSGGFDKKELLAQNNNPYMVGVADFDDSLTFDIYVVKDSFDQYLLNDGNGTDGYATFTSGSAESSRTTSFGGNVGFADLDGDGDVDVLVSDIDITEPSCDRQLALLRNQTSFDAGTPVCDPYRATTEPAWLTRGTFDTAVIPNFDGNGRPGMFCGTCDGSRFFQRVQATGAQLPFVDCDNNGNTDSCDINKDETLDCDGNGIIDTCPNGFQPCGCEDGDVCTFDVCITGNPQQCTNTTALYADVHSFPPPPYGFCGPDGVVNQSDVDAVVLAFEGEFVGCCTFDNLDIAGPGLSCGGDGMIWMEDLFAVQNAMNGSDPCCSGGPGPPSCPPDLDDPIIIFDPTPIYPSPAQVGDPIIAFEVDVHVYTSGQLRGYQVELEITGAQANHAVISDISVDQSKPTYVFSAAPSGDVDAAIDLSGLRMMSAVRSGGVNIRSYLMTFRLDRAPGAPQSFTVTVQTKPQTQIADPNGCGDSPDIITEIFTFE